MYDINRYDFPLPKDLIAQKPLKERSKCRLMVVKPNKIEHGFFWQLPEYLERGDLLLMNDSKVVPAKLVGNKFSGGKVKVLLIKKVEGDARRAIYEAFISGKKIKPGIHMTLANRNLEAKCLEHIMEGRFLIELTATTKHSIEYIIKTHGLAPLPPYIKNSDIPIEQYQTVYSRNEGSIAAPTAGLHFDENLLKNLRSQGIRIGYLTLHVGPGTFMEVKVNDVRRHVMEEEYYCIPKKTIKLYETAIEKGNKIIAVGTTTIRTLEASTDTDGNIVRSEGWADVFIYPPYNFKSKVDAMITNFHIPKSTLIMLVCAFGGYNNVMKAYRIAVKERYRFYSFGDAMFLYRGEYSGYGP